LGQAFGTRVGALKGSANLVEDDVVREDVLPEPMEIDMEVLRAISQPLTCREMVSALIVLKYSSSNSCVDRCRDVALCSKVL
jgi:hypothetical protein